MAGFRNERGLPRIHNIELPEKNARIRWILACVLLLIGGAAIAVGVHSCVSAQAGWQEVQVSSANRNCSQDFVFNYCYGASGVDPTTERSRVVTCYSQAVEDAYAIFNTGIADSSLGNLTLLNAHPNEAVTVEPELYDALEKICASGSRHVYLAAVYEQYDHVFSSALDGQAEDFDPAKNEEARAYVEQLAAFAADPDQIDLQLLENDRVKLRISQSYLDFAEENGLTDFLGLGWMKNAFIADFLAERLSREGFTKGYLASYDGFTRNLDNGGESYSFNLFDRQGNEIFLPGTLQYSKAMSIVFLRNYPMTDRDAAGFYGYSDNTITTALIDPTDGMSKSATDNLVAYSTNVSCGEIVLKVASIYVQDEWDAAALQSLTADGIYSIWFEGSKLQYNQKDVQIDMHPVEGTTYRAEYAGK